MSVTADPPPLDFEAWTQTAARLLRRTPIERAEILEQLGLAAEAWERCDDHYARVMASELAAGQRDGARRYGARCAEELQGRAAAPEPAAKPEPAPPPAAEPPAPAAPSPAMALPTYLAAPGPTLPAVAAPPRAPRPRPVTLLDSPGAAAAATNAPLPFHAPPAGPPAPPHGTPERLPPPPDGELPADTGTLPLSQPGTDAPLPFAAADPGVKLSLEQYASLRAELGVFPEKRAEILVRYGLGDDKAGRDLDEVWRRQFATDRPAQRRFLQLATQYRDYLLEQKGK